MQQTQTLSVVITTYNRPDALAAVLAACFLQDDKNFEIIIADDGSTANTRDCVARLAAGAPVPVKHVWQPDDGFRAAIRSGSYEPTPPGSRLARLTIKQVYPAKFARTASSSVALGSSTVRFAV